MDISNSGWLLLLANITPFLHDMSHFSDYVYLQQDNASPHWAALTQNRFHTLEIWGYFIHWLPSSPDCSPIENLWRIMK